MSQACQQAFDAYDAKRRYRCRYEKFVERLRRNRNNTAAVLGLSVTTILAIAGALAATASSGVALPAAIAAAIGILGYAAIFIGIADLGALITLIIRVINAENKLAEIRDEESEARGNLIKANAEEPEELARYLGIPSIC